MAADVGLSEEFHLLDGFSHGKLHRNALRCFLTASV